MKIAVCLKYGLDVDEVQADPDTMQLRLDNVPRKFGNYDYNALTEAARLGDGLDAVVHILVFGPESAKEGLNEAMAMGADEATIVADPSGGFAPTPLAVEVIATACEKLGGFDLFLCGEASIDGASYQFAPRLAQRLGIPYLTYANRIKVKDGEVIIDRNVANRSEHYKGKLPMVISASAEINEPAKPTLMQVLKAKDKPINLWSLSENLDLQWQALVQSTPLELQNKAGVRVKRKEVVIEGEEPVTAAAKLIDRLENEGMLSDE